MISKSVLTYAPETLKHSLRQIKRRITFFKFAGSGAPAYTCPVCDYTGLFLDDPVKAPVRCVKCGSFPRHRLIILALDTVFTDEKWRKAAVLHVAPEVFFKQQFEIRFDNITTCDIAHPNVDRNEDLRSLSFPDASFDIVCASYVLEHIDDDLAALSEIKRVLRPGGAAILPVPLVCERTVEYGVANPHEFYHVRAPGWDYYERYSAYFNRIEIFRSEDFDQRYQLYAYEDRSKYPTPQVPLRPAMCGTRHSGACPICWV